MLYPGTRHQKAQVTDREKEAGHMANKNLFAALVGKLIPVTDSVNQEQAPAYALSPRHKLAQYAATGCLNATFMPPSKSSSIPSWGCAA